jgi:hypothetical protein
MIPLPFARKGLKRLLLVCFTGVAAATVAIAADVGFPFSEDFTADNLKDPSTTADWDVTVPGTLRPGLATALTGMDVSRSPLGNAGEVVTYSRDIALGDLDGDGDLDAVTSNTGQDNVGAVNSIYLNSGTALDQAPIPLGTDSLASRGIAIGDLDRDGDLDVVAGNFQNRNVMYLNDGSGGFTEGTPIGVANRQTWRIALVDVDGDTDLDIIEAVSSDRNFLYINLFRENRGRMSFRDGTPITNENFTTRAMAVGDIDNDGDPDFIAGDQNVGNHIYEWENGSYQAAGMVHDNTNVTFSLSLADLDGDGSLDLVEGSSGAATLVYFNQGDGTFNSPTVVANSLAAHTTVSLITRDFDRDGDIDIMEGNNGAWDHDGDGSGCVDPGGLTACQPQPVRLFLNNGDGTFADAIEDVPPQIQKIYGSDAGDINGDGLLDFVTAHSANNPNGPAALASNAAYVNIGTTGGSLERQLDSVALSLEVDGGGNAIPDARLDATLLQATGLFNVDFYLSNDGGQTFVPAAPGIPVKFPDPSGNALLWKAEFLAHSPAALDVAAGITQLDIAANNAPTFDNIGPINGVEGQALPDSNMNDYFSDADGDELYFLVSGLPDNTGLTLNPQTGELAGVLSSADAGASPILMGITAFDGADWLQGFITVNVTETVDDPPIANDDGPYTIEEGGSIAGEFNVLDNDSDPEGQALTAVLVDPPLNSSLFELRPDGTFDYTHDGFETTEDSFTYRASDGVLQSDAATVSITITPVNDPPTISLIGDATVSVVQGGVYNDAGATANDAEDGDISADIVVGGDTVDTDTIGSYVITYDVTDSGGLAATQVTRTVNVVTNNAPVITLVGDATVNVVQGTMYTDAGATATDAEDGDLTDSIVVGGDVVDTNTIGTYVITYDVSDSNGNAAAQVSRTVNVTADTAPVITLVGSGSITLTVGDAYNEQGATATDAEDGDISADIVITGTVNTAAAGTYTVRYNVTDSAGNAAAEVTRTVTVNAAPKKKSGGGAVGMLEIAGLLMLAGLVMFRRRRTANIRTR